MTITPTVILSRRQAADMLGITTRTLHNYLDIARVFIPSFYDFEDYETGGLNRFKSLELWHIPKLQRMIDYCRSHGLKKLRIELKNNPIYFERGSNNDDNQTTGSEISPDHSQETAIRVYAEIS